MLLMLLMLLAGSRRCISLSSPGMARLRSFVGGSGGLPLALVDTLLLLSWVYGLYGFRCWSSHRYTADHGNRPEKVLVSVADVLENSTLVYYLFL